MTSEAVAPDPDAVDWLPLPDLAERIGEDTRKVRQLLHEGRLVTVRRDGVQVVPAAFVADGHLVKGLTGLVTLLHDAGYDEEQSVAWMLRTEESLGGSPLAVMAEGRGREVKRLAQTLGF
ncbi:MAG: DNA-binding protein [Streptosporangiales bacterium]|nr:DNA-binding protein [Streptosporangiales bacterium]